MALRDTIIKRICDTLVSTFATDNYRRRYYRDLTMGREFQAAASTIAASMRQQASD